MSKKNYDNHNRWRNKTVAFRVSAEEDLQLETLVKLTGLTKQDYIIRRLLERDVVVQGNPRVYKALRDQLAAVLDELRRIEAGQGVNGELLALTPADFDFEKRTLTINKSYQRINKQDVITTPKTPKSNRVIQMPQFLCDELQDYLKQLYGVEPDSRMFPISKSYLHREMDRGCKQTGVKRIRIHDLRHSHISLLIDMGFTALAIAERVGHESIDITYRYAHLFPTRQVEMADKLDLLKNEKGG